MFCEGAHKCEDDGVQHTCDLGALELHIQINRGQIAQNTKKQNNKCHFLDRLVTKCASKKIYSPNYFWR